MKNRHKELLLFAGALATTFSLYPSTNYQTAFPKRSAASRMDAAWERTGRTMRLAAERVKRKYDIAC
ncbi:hypothetical protein L0Z11_26225 [Burkholderia multivorans]|uniref:hypothetical protein n=1 Tax=Burkholderia multivorans TaxID=87883 RepID=UPI002019361B|nr:hypothetical protein [Burkholderia multivorans]MDN7743069.1 hypothetical protein [Burkholderia multivorans]UQN71765.1 hypothetical protein L0Z45_26195 [Burkholderia multivorans]UQN77501.1 hypothetical protein L0Z11_26225 [Burkholderia multivorans]